jgi:protein-disulfide isomerase
VRRRAPAAAAWALALLLAGCGGSDVAPAPIPPGPLKVTLGDSPRRGPDDAWVTVVEYSDFQCPYCAQAEPLVRQLLAERPADVRLVYRHFPLTSLHPAALPAAEATECARLQPRPGTGDGFFWEVHDGVLGRHADLVAAASAPGPLLRDVAAGVAGLDLAAWDACMAGDGTLARVQADLDRGWQAYGVNATPTFVVNGSKVVGAAGLRAAVDGALAWALQSGLPRADYYDRAVLGL